VVLARDPSARRAFLDGGRDDAVRAEVDRLLAGHEAAGSFGDVPLVARGGDVLHTRCVSPRTLNGSSAADTADRDLDGDAPEPAPGSNRSPSHHFLWIVWLAALVSAGMFTYAASVLIGKGGTTSAFGWAEVRRDGQWFVSRLRPHRAR
jgi:hypothetical protein